jgi:hypothetical protein
VSQQEWEYSTVFDKNNILSNSHNELIFNGVNGYALFFLNGKPLLRQEGDSLVNFTDNAFRTYRFLLPKQLKKNDNILTVRFLYIHKIQNSKFKI